MKEVIYIPIIHTQVDLGTMAYPLKMEYTARYGENAWRQHTKAINDMWDGLRKKIFNLNLPYKRTRIYQDSLPVFGAELKIIRGMAAMGSPNHEIILDLVKKGANLEGTEDPNLLVQEYNNLKALYQTTDTREKIKATKSYKRAAGKLIIKRDKFIAKRIEKTLLENEIAIVFMGVQHAVPKYLTGLKIFYLINRLPFRESYLSWDAFRLSSSHKSGAVLEI